MIASAVAAGLGSRPQVCGADEERGDPRISFLKERTASDPLDFLSPARLGALYLQKGREGGDFGLYLKAEEALKKALERKSDHRPAMLSLGAAFLAQHRFREAAALAGKAVEADPQDAEAQALLGDARLELGDLDGAGASYRRALELVPGLFSHARLARLQYLKGETSSAIASYHQALEESARSYTPKEDVSWCLVELGELYFKSGDWENAEARYKEALGATARSWRALEHLAELRAAQRKYTEALALYEQAIALAPLPELQQAVGDVYAAMGKPQEAEKWHALALEGYLRAAKAGLSHYDHHLAGFFSEVKPDPAEARRWAEKDLAARASPAAQEALAWALYRGGEFARAREAMEKALVAGTKDAHRLYHASLIFHAAGDSARGREYLAQAAAANPRFTEFHAHR